MRHTPLAVALFALLASPAIAHAADRTEDADPPATPIDLDKVEVVGQVLSRALKSENLSLARRRFQGSAEVLKVIS